MSTVSLEDLEDRSTKGTLYCVDAVVCLLGLIPPEERDVQEAIMDISRRAWQMTRKQGLVLLAMHIEGCLNHPPPWLSVQRMNALTRFTRAVRAQAAALDTNVPARRVSSAEIPVVRVELDDGFTSGGGGNFAWKFRGKGFTHIRLSGAARCICKADASVAAIGQYKGQPEKVLEHTAEKSLVTCPGCRRGLGLAPLEKEDVRRTG